MDERELSPEERRRQIRQDLQWKKALEALKKPLPRRGGGPEWWSHLSFFPDEVLRMENDQPLFDLAAFKRRYEQARQDFMRWTPNELDLQEKKLRDRIRQCEEESETIKKHGFQLIEQQYPGDENEQTRKIERHFLKTGGARAWPHALDHLVVGYEPPQEPSDGFWEQMERLYNRLNEINTLVRGYEHTLAVLVNIREQRLANVDPAVWEDYYAQFEPTPEELQQAYEAAGVAEQVEEEEKKTPDYQREIEELKKNNQALNNEARVRNSVILRLKRKVAYKNLPTEIEMRALIDKHRFKRSEKANLSALGSELGITGDTAKRWIQKLGLSSYAKI